MSTLKLAKSITILADGKLSIFLFDNTEVYLQPTIIVDTLDSLQRLKIRDSVNYVDIDTSIEFINGVAFSGDFAQLEISVRETAKNANNITESETSAYLQQIEYNTATDYPTEVARGLIQGRFVINQWGVNQDSDIAAPEIVATFGGAFNPVTGVMRNAQTFTINYTNSTDGQGTTGALSLLIIYLDASFVRQTEVHVLGSTGIDITSFTGIGINQIYLLSSGTLGYNVNNITFTATTDLTTQAQIPPLASVSQQAIYHTQIGSSFLLDWLFLNALKDSGGGSPKVTFNMYSWSRVTLTRYLVFTYKLDTADNEGMEIKLTQKFPIGGREVFWIEATVSANNTSCAARFSGVEIVNP